MANFTFTGGTATIGTTEYSIAQNANYSSGSPKTTLGIVWAVIDLNAMAAGDTFQIKTYEKVNGGTQRQLLDPITLSGAQGQLYVIALGLVGEGWDITIRKIAGTDRSIGFSVRQDTNDVNVASFTAATITAAVFAANAITSTVIAADAIGATQIATDAIDADALKTDVITEIQAGLATSSAQTTAQTDLTTLTGRLTSTRAGLLDNLDAAVTSRAPSATALSTLQWTNARSGFLDNLNVGGNVASSSEVTAIQNNTRVVRVVPAIIERPDIGTQAFVIEVLLYDEVGNMETPDSAPTIALVNQALTDLSARLSSTTMTLISTGRYRVTYTADVTDALEQLIWTFSIVEGGATRLYGNSSVIVDTTAVDFTAVDRAKLDTLAADYTTARAVKIDNLDTTVGSRASSGALTALQSDVTANGIIITGTAAAVIGIQADTDNIQTRLPTALDVGTGSIKAIIDAGALASIATNILSSVVDVGITALAAPVNITVVGALRLLLSEATAKVSGFLTGTPVYRDTADTKARISGTVTSDGRTSVSVDPT